MEGYVNLGKAYGKHIRAGGFVHRPTIFGGIGENDLRLLVRGIATSIEKALHVGDILVAALEGIGGAGV